MSRVLTICPVVKRKWWKLMGCLKLWFKPWNNQVYGILNVYDVMILFLYLKLLHILDSEMWKFWMLRIIGVSSTYLMFWKICDILWYHRSWKGSVFTDYLNKSVFSIIQFREFGIKIFGCLLGYFYCIWEYYIDVMCKMDKGSGRL